MEQIDMFEIDLNAAEKLFKKQGIQKPEYGETLVFTSKSCTTNNITTHNVKINGQIVNYNNNGIVVMDAWVTKTKEETDKGFYSETAFLPIKDVQKIEPPRPFNFTINAAYRAEIYKRNEATNRPTTWISCYYRGTTKSGKIVLIEIGDNKEVIVLEQRDIKGFFQLSLDEMQHLPQTETTDDIEEFA